MSDSMRPHGPTAADGVVRHAEAGGLELPDAPGLWTRGPDEWAWVIRRYGGDLFADAWHIPSEKRTVYLGTRYSDLPKGHWHPAPTDAAELRAEVERLRGQRDELQTGIAEREERLRGNFFDQLALTARAESAEAERDQMRAKLAEAERERASTSAAFWKLAAMYESDVEMENQQRPGWATAIIEQARKDRDQLAERVAVLEEACAEFKSRIMRDTSIPNASIGAVMQAFDETIARNP